MFPKREPSFSWLTCSLFFGLESRTWQSAQGGFCYSVYLSDEWKLHPFERSFEWFLHTFHKKGFNLRLQFDFLFLTRPNLGSVPIEFRFAIHGQSGRWFGIPNEGKCSIFANDDDRTIFADALSIRCTTVLRVAPAREAVFVDYPLPQCVGWRGVQILQKHFLLISWADSCK